MSVIHNGTVLLPDGTLRKRDICIDNGIIKSIDENYLPEGEEVIDAGDCIVAPGYVDIHIHGANGSDFCDGSNYAFDTIAKYLLQEGVTSFLGTTMSLDEVALSGIMDTAVDQTSVACEGRAAFRGIHMEGPFFAKNRKGAQNGEFLRNPDFDMFKRLYDKSGGIIKIIDLAPELAGSNEFIEQVTSFSKISLAHTDTDYETAKKAFRSGASYVTHLFNAMTPINHRNPGIIVAAQEDAEFIELICDGVHVHPAVVRFTFQMFGKNRVCIVSDSMRACGLPDGEYDLGGQVISVKGDRATLKNGTLAGSTTSIAKGVKRAVSFGVPIEDALIAATINPAKAAGLDDMLGSLKPGLRADIILLNKQLDLQTVYLAGRKQKVY